MAIVPDDFPVPRELRADGFRLEPLGPEHNERDHAAWTGSIPHIRATPGFTTGGWPPEAGMSLEKNLADLTRHADDFAQRKGFTFSVLENPGDDVIGCVYIYPKRDEPEITQVYSWVRADHAHLDKPLYETVAHWLSEEWPLGEIRYDARN